MNGWGGPQKMQRPFMGAKARIVCTYMYSLLYPPPCIDEKRKKKEKKEIEREPFFPLIEFSVYV